MSSTTNPEAPAVSTFIWFRSEAEEAARVYAGLLPDGETGPVTRYPTAGPGWAAEAVATAEFRLAGQRFVALNGGEDAPHSHAMSVSIELDRQEDIDRITEALIAGGGAQMDCGWVRDRWGVRWQVTPRPLLRMLGAPDRAAAARAMAAMITMQRLDIAALERAFRGEA